MLKQIALLIVLSASAFADIGVNVQSQTYQNYAQPADQSYGYMADDKRIQSEVQNLIKNKTKQYNINIMVRQGNVTLSGYVENNDDKQNLEREIRKIKGVKEVKNLLNIKKQSD